MRKIMWSVFAILAVASCLAFIGPAWAQQAVYDYAGESAYHETIVCGITASGPSSTYVSATMRPRSALISVYSANVVVSFHGTAASATVGHPMSSGDSYEVRPYSDVKNISCINATSGTTGALRVTYRY